MFSLKRGALRGGLLIVIGACLLPALPIQAQQSALQRADSLFRAQDFAEAAKAYKEASKRYPDLGRVWFQYGLSLHYTKQYKEAVKAYKRAEEMNVNPATTRYNLACAYSLLGKLDEAFAWLDKSIESGFNTVAYVAGDTDLDNLRQDPRFPEYLKRVEAAAAPCESNPNCRQLDFWIGLWDVYGLDGNQIGVNRITKSLKGCMIIEEWRSALGIEGKSIKYFDPGIGHWRENWVAESGSITEYTGDLIEGVMHFEGETHFPSGRIIKSRSTISPLPEGKVHHLIEQSYDNGRTWSVFFDGTYVLRQEELSKN